MNHQTRAILWAQFRSLKNYYPRASKGGIAFTAITTFLWYGAWAAGSVLAAVFSAGSGSLPLLNKILPSGMFLAFLYWQLIPILMAAAGASLDLKKLVVYPIPLSSLFGMEVLLRVTVGLEMLLMLSGLSVGLLLNRGVPFWGPLGIAAFAAFNMFLSAGLRDLLARLLAKKRIREVFIFLLVLVSALPQLVLSSKMQIPAGVKKAFSLAGLAPWPWVATAELALGHWGIWNAMILLGCVGGAYWFGRWQFERGLNFDTETIAAEERATSRTSALAERLYQIPSFLFADPLGALIEKEVRFLSRAPRFRLIFFMGFTFGLLIWLPLTFGRNPNSLLSSNYLTIVCVYALMCLGEVTFWNTFGFDRSAAQNYFVLPVKLSTVLIAKNITAVLFVFLEIAIVTTVCFALRLPITVQKLGESAGVAVVLTPFLLAMGNLSSMYNPRPVNPGQSWRSGGASKTQALLLLVYPLISAPVGLAYLARYAFESQLAFYAVLAFDVLVGMVVYVISLETALTTAYCNREKLLGALAKGASPISS